MVYEKSGKRMFHFAALLCALACTFQGHEDDNDDHQHYQVYSKHQCLTTEFQSIAIAIVSKGFVQHLYLRFLIINYMCCVCTGTLECESEACILSCQEKMRLDTRVSTEKYNSVF